MTKQSDRSKLESSVQSEIEIALGAERDFVLMRNGVGVAKHVDERTGDLRFVTYGLGVGTPDLVGILAPWGRWVGLELKRPKGGRVAEAQKNVHRVWREFGALVYVVRSVVEARAALDDARRVSSGKGSGGEVRS